MAKIHVLAGVGLDTYQVVVHAATPSGDNAAGMSWADAIKNSGRASSVMLVGSGPGQITAEELAQVESGAVIEGSFLWGDDPAWTNGQRQADLDLRATQMVNELLTRYQQELKYFGFARA